MLVMLALSHLEVPTDGGFIEVEAHGLQSENQQLLVSARFFLCGKRTTSRRIVSQEVISIVGSQDSRETLQFSEAVTDFVRPFTTGHYCCR
jgi:hypothetical protein